jgi:hypothetical protein
VPCQIHAKVIGLILQCRVLLTWCWRIPDRSVPKVLRTLRRFASTMASGFHCLLNTKQILRLLDRILPAG